jgi:hypothetical protein
MRSSAAVVAVLLVARPVAADPPPRTVTLAVDDCVEADRAQLDRLVALELAAAIPGARLGEHGAALELGCDGDRVRIGWRGGHADFERVIDPGPPAARARTIALAAVELAVAGWLEHRPAPAPAPPRVAIRHEVRLVDVVLDEPARPRRWDSRVAVAGRVLAAGDLAATGATVAIARDRATAAGWGWSIEAGAARGEDDVALGAIRLDALTAAGAARLGVRAGPARLHAGAGARLSAVRFRGVPGPGASAGEVTGVAGGPLAAAGATACAGRLCLDGGVEAGWHALEVRAEIDGAPGRALAGAWWSAHLGAALRW